MKLKKKTKKGFTLIELLIVVAIIAILAAIAIPQFAKYRVRGYNSAADSDLRNMKIAIEAFATDNQVYASTVGITTPPAGTYATTQTGGVSGIPGNTIGGPVSYTVNVTQASIQGVPGNLPSATVNMLFGLSNGVLAMIATDPTGGSEGTHYVAVTANSSGDTIFASDSGLTSLMRAGKDSGGASTPIADATPGANMTWAPLAALGGIGDLDSNFSAM